MMTNIFWIIGWFLGVYCGWNLHKSYMESIIKKLEKMEEDEKDNVKFSPSLQDEVINVIIKKSDNIFYVYAEKDNMFLAQGVNAKEIGVKLAERFPDKKFFASQENAKEVGFR